MNNNASLVFLPVVAKVEKEVYSVDGSSGVEVGGETVQWQGLPRSFGV